MTSKRSAANLHKIGSNAEINSATQYTKNKISESRIGEKPSNLGLGSVNQSLETNQIKATANLDLDRKD